jgi:hypothetical protein
MAVTHYKEQSREGESARCGDETVVMEAWGKWK